jgi:hypothetical protein
MFVGHVPDGTAGRDWFTVLSGTIVLRLGERTILVRAGGAAEFSTMEPHAFGAARASVAEADAGGRAPTPAQAESIARDWWARKQVSVPRRPISKVEVVRTGIGTEKR